MALRSEKKPTDLSLGFFWVEIAKLGGFPARKSHGDPGWLRLWQGWLQLLDFAEGARWLEAQKNNLMLLHQVVSLGGPDG